MSEHRTITIADGVDMQQLGLGVWQVPDAEAASVVRTAIDAGYRSIDTAAIYKNEAGVGAVDLCGDGRLGSVHENRQLSQDAQLTSRTRRRRKPNAAQDSGGQPGSQLHDFPRPRSPVGRRDYPARLTSQEGGCDVMDEL